MFDFATIIGKEITVGFGDNKNRLVVDWGYGGITFLAGKDTIETAEKESITIKISPEGVVLQEACWIFPYQFALRLGRHRFLTAISRSEEDLVMLYLADEDDIVLGQSEFMRLAGN